MAMKRLLAAGALAAIAACDDVNVHILSGQEYNPALACVGATAGVDVVQGASTGDNCDPTCLTATQGTSTYTYVTTTCPPYPGDYTVEAQDAATSPSDPCTGAFAAYAAYNAGATDAACPPPGSCADGGEAGADGACPTGDAGAGEASSAGDGGADATTE
jgi:hypothetical protein